MYTLMNSAKTERAYTDLDVEDLDIEGSDVLENANVYKTVDTTGGSSRSYNSNPLSNINGGVVGVAAIVSFIIAIIVFVTIVEKKKAPRGKFLRWLREYLNFRSILIAGIIKFVYIFSAVLLTIMSVVVMCQGRDEMVLPMIGIGLAILVFGNIFLRIMMEMTMAIISMWENTSDIRGVLVKEEEKPEEKEPKKPEPEPEPKPAPEPEPVAEPTPEPAPEVPGPEEVKVEPVVEETMIAEQFNAQ